MRDWEDVIANTLGWGSALLLIIFLGVVLSAFVFYPYSSYTYQVTCKNDKNEIVLDRRFNGGIYMEDNKISSFKEDFAWTIPYNVSCEKIRIKD